MKLKGVNAASVKSMEAIKNAFAELIAEKKEINSITVTELVKRANLTRGTFYAHYENIYDVANQFQEEILKQVLTFDTQIKTKEELNAYIDQIFTYLKNNQDIYFKLLASNEAKIFMDWISKKICSSLENIISKENKLNVIFFTDGTINLIVKFFQKEIPYALTN